MIFACSICPQQFSIMDVEAGKYFPSTGTCLTCYQSMMENKALCFGRKEKYDLRTIACQQCPDNKICKIVIKHKKEFYKEKMNESRSR